MKKLYSLIIDTLNKAISLSLSFLCLGIIAEVDDKILRQSFEDNFQDAGSSFIGVIALVVLYLLFIKK